jgi:hypothetical protein
LTKDSSHPHFKGCEHTKEAFIELAKNHAVDMLQPDLATAGGILETHKIGDAIQEYGMPMVLHMAMSPVACFASVHCAAATENFLVLENHSVDRPEWGDIVEGVPKPIIQKGFIPVPEGPGLGITLNEEAVKKQLSEPGSGGFSRLYRKNHRFHPLTPPKPEMAKKMSLTIRIVSDNGETRAAFVGADLPETPMLSGPVWLR